MTAAEALELALGLLHAPARRELLASRPLPAGMTGLLAVAAGSLAAQLEASARTGATREELQEAARFFVQQVLLVPGADAYRTLGAAADAPQSRLHEHHRLLQRWLHPDRDTDHAWDSAFSARVNAAWSRVRTPHAREAYDAELATLTIDDGEPESPAPPEAGHARDPGISEAGFVVPTPDEIIYRNPASPAGRGYALNLSAAPGTPATPIRPPLRRPAAILTAVAAIALAWFAFQHEPAPPEAATADRGDAPEALADTVPGDASGSADAGGVIDVGHVAPAPDLIREPTYVPDALPILTPEDVPGSVADVDRAETTTAGRDHAPDVLANTGSGDASGSADVGGAIDVGRPEPAPDLIREPTGATDGLPAAPAPTSDPFALFEEAEHAVAQLTRWLASGEERSPPIWNDVGTEAAAARARAALHERRSGRRAGELAIDAPRWTLGNDRAAMDGGYRHGSRRAGEQGRLQVELVRREERWLVTAVHMEPAQ